MVYGIVTVLYSVEDEKKQSILYSLWYWDWYQYSGASCPASVNRTSVKAHIAESVTVNSLVQTI